MTAEAMVQISKITGREYKPFVYYGDPDAENIIIAMGSVTETIKETVDYLRAKGEKVGVITVHLYRPFSAKYLLNVLPKSVKRICVLDRTKEPGANGDPLYLDVKDIFYGQPGAPMIIGGRYGLSSKDTTPAQMLAVFNNLKANEPKNQFTVGIVDDVTFKSLPVGEEISLAKPGTFEALFFGLGADGTVGANKNSIKIIGGSTDKYCQAYFSYDSKKSGGYTSSHLRFGDKPITSPYLVTTPDFVACHVPSYVDKYDVLKGLKKGGSFLLNSIHDAETTKETLPDHMKKYLAENQINFYIINATKIAMDLGLGSRTNTIMQSAFFKIANVIPFDKAVEEMKKAIYKTYGKKGEEIVSMNYAAVDKGGAEVHKVEVPAEWADITVKENGAAADDVPEFISKVVRPINALKGDDLPVSAFLGREDGTWDAGTAAYEKRGIAVNVPQWLSENCIQCNQCAYVCPHAVIRPFLLTDEEVAAAPEGMTTLQGVGATKAYKFRIQISPLDCTGCSNCADVCPAPTKALVMKPLESQLDQEKYWDYLTKRVGYKDTVVDKTKTVKNSQFAQPLFEFSGACAGCGETPYIKLITQMFGDRMMVANATGCSSIYGGSAPSTPYTTNSKGQGPAWANSLFEDNAEFGLGMHLGVEKLRERVALKMQDAIANCSCCSAELKAAMQEWIDGKDSSALSAAASEKLIPMTGGLRLRYLQGDPRVETVFREKIAVDHRRRRLGLRYRIRRRGPCARFGCRRQHPDPRHRGLFEYGRTVVEGHPGGRHREIRLFGQAYPQKGYGSHCDDLRLHLCGAGFDRSQPEPVFPGDQGGRGLSRSVADHRLRTVYQPRHQGRYDPHADRRQRSCSLRLLAAVALQPDARRAGQESVLARLERAGSGVNSASLSSRRCAIRR